MSEEGLPPVEEWPDWNDQPLGANPMEQDINAPYDKVRNPACKKPELLN